MEYLEGVFHAEICASLFLLPTISLFLYNYNTYIYNTNTILIPIYANISLFLCSSIGGERVSCFVVVAKFL